MYGKPSLSLNRPTPAQDHTTKQIVSLQGQVSMNCPICNSDRVRRSRLRIRDVLLLLALHYPVRCRECSERWYVGIWAASKLPCPGGRVATIR